MASQVGYDRTTTYRQPGSALPDKPDSVPYEIRTETRMVDFSNAVNPLGTPKNFIQQMHTSLVDGELNYAPDRDGREFRRTIARKLQISPDAILLGTTPTQLITYAAMAFDYGSVGVSTPCMPEFLSAIANAGHHVLELSNSVSFVALDAYSAYQQFGDFQGVVLGNPSYPASRLLSRNALIHYLETGCWAIVDESHIELSIGAESVVPLIDTYPNLMVIRNPSVTYAMPGVPISYLVAQPQTIESIGRFYDGSDVSMFAEVLASRMANQNEYLDQTHDYLDVEIPWMYNRLSLIPGVMVHPAEGNFVLCEFNPRDDMRLCVSGTEELVIRLQLAGYFVRYLARTPGLQGRDYFCVAVNKHDDNVRLLNMMRRIISGER